MRFFIGGYILLWLVQMQLFIAWDILRHPVWCPYACSLYSVIAFLFFTGIVIFALKKPETFSLSPKYRSSTLQESEKKNYHKKLLALMQNDQIYLNPSLLLPELSQEPDIAPCYLSQVMNESFHQDFNGFVNKYRIEKSKLFALASSIMQLAFVASSSEFTKERPHKVL